ncbi:MAG: acetyl-CoA carboxylase carboxyltransferase subunit alpha [Pseudomonadota bacterium]
MQTFLEFEKPIAELEDKISELRALSGSQSDVNLDDEIATLSDKVERTLTELYSNLSAWQKAQVARHAGRPHFSDYMTRLMTDFTPLAGDRNFADDEAIMGGLARFRGQSVVVMGHEKGKDTKSRLHHNFGMARPEGYRKAVRLMDLADRYDIPVVSFVDTSGAYPGVGAEERGQAEAIARSTAKCLDMKVPMVTAIVGEGGSGGAVAIAVGNRVIMLEHSIYSVISPEGCASILWRSAEKASEAAKQLRFTAQDLLSFGIIDTVISEPIGGAHRDPAGVIDALGNAIDGYLYDMAEVPADTLREEREEKFLAMGQL